MYVRCRGRARNLEKERGRAWAAPPQEAAVREGCRGSRSATKEGCHQPSAAAAGIECHWHGCIACARVRASEAHDDAPKQRVAQRLLFAGW